MSNENLAELLAKRAPKPRSKLTTALAAVLVLLIGIFLGAIIGKGSASSGTTTNPTVTDLPATGSGPGAGRPASGTVDTVDGNAVTITTDAMPSLAPGDTVVVIKPPVGGPGPGSPSGISP